MVAWCCFVLGMGHERGNAMKKMMTVWLLGLLAGGVHAAEVSDLSGMWLIESYKEIKGGELITADGTDFWEFTDTKYSVHASGFQFPEVDYSVQGDTITIKKKDGDQTVKIDQLENAVMKANDGRYTYNLIKQ